MLQQKPACRISLQRDAGSSADCSGRRNPPAVFGVRFSQPDKGCRDQSFQMNALASMPAAIPILPPSSIYAFALRRSVVSPGRSSSFAAAFWASARPKIHCRTSSGSGSVSVRSTPSGRRRPGTSISGSRGEAVPSAPGREAMIRTVWALLSIPGNAFSGKSGLLRESR